jgi:hypothetical protein
VSAARDAARLVVDLVRIRGWSAEGAYEAGDDLPPVVEEPVGGVAG